MAVRRSRAGTRSSGSSVSFGIRGAEGFADLARDLRKAGDKDLMRQVTVGMTAAIAPVRKSVRKSAKTTLPKRGGLAKRVASTKITTKRKLSGRQARVSMVATSGYDIKRMDQGKVRHPVYGNRKNWVNQTVPSGWWSDPIDRARPVVRIKMETVLRMVAREFDRRHK